MTDDTRVQADLLSGETVVASSQMHPAAAYQEAVAAGAVGVLAGFVGAIAMGDPVAVLVLPLLFVPIVAIAAAVGWFRLSTSVFVVTDKRVIAKTGAFTKRSFELRLDQVEGVAAERNVLASRFGYGTLVVTGTGGSATPLIGVKEVDVIRQAVQSQR